jgi:hypothetical protein
MGFNRRKMEEKEALSRRATDAQVLEGCRAPDRRLERAPGQTDADAVLADSSTIVFAPVGSYLAELSRALDELALSPRAFLVGRGLIAEAVDFLACHLGCFAPASFATPTRNNAANKTAALCEPANGDRPRRMIALFAPPLIHAVQE